MSSHEATDPRSHEVTAMRQALLRWYRRHRRDLPWRSDTPNPYHVLVSEAMLQQTQVATVIDYFHRFVDRFPTAQALAEADEQEVLRQWQGLGYYRRARNLWRAARRIVQEHGGRVPDSVEALQSLPGVGRYTAGAIASIAFGRREPILDGNVARVLARLFAIERPVDDAGVRHELWALAEAFVHRARRPGDVNQSLMELGAVVCAPRQPRCSTCPVAKHCQAYAQTRTDELPRKATRAAQRQVRHDVIAITFRGGRGRWLFEQRPGTGLWSGMWQLLTLEDADADALAAAVRDKVGLDIAEPNAIGSFTHITTHRRIRFVVHVAQATAGRLKRGVGVWRDLDAIDDLPMSNAQRKAIDLVKAHQQGAAWPSPRRPRG